MQGSGRNGDADAAAGLSSSRDEGSAAPADTASERRLSESTNQSTSPLGRMARGWRAARTGLAFVSLGVLSLCLALLIMPPLRLIPGEADQKERRAQRALHWIVRGYLRWLRILRLCRIEYTGGERLLAPGTLVVANHPTFLDALTVMAVMPQVDCVVKQSYYDHPFLAGSARGAGYIPSRDGAELVDECVERLLRGRSVIIFPEGTRSPPNGLAPFARGAAHIALRSGRDPVPVAIRCEPATLHRDQRWWQVPDRRFTLTLDVGQPIVVKESLALEAAQPLSRSRAARALTASLRHYFQDHALNQAAQESAQQPHRQQADPQETERQTDVGRR
jgi:1-acyl-sn-glycerol-3-phosphate acyltransferase